MTNQRTVRERADEAVRVWKFIQALVGAGALASAIWAQFLGPGLGGVARSFFGIDELSERLSWVEEFMPAPTVVEWISSNQVAPCQRGRCGLVLTGSRTAYGEACGRPTAVEPYLRERDGRLHQLDFERGFSPVELTRAETTFEVPLMVPLVVPNGSHQVRFRITYPTCPGRREPIPRWTPWWDLEVGPELTSPFAINP